MELDGAMAEFVERGNCLVSLTVLDGVWQALAASTIQPRPPSPIDLHRLRQVLASMDVQAFV